MNEIRDFKPNKKGKKKAWIIAIVILLVIFGGVFTFDAVRAIFMKKFFSNFAPPPQVVSAITVKPQDWQPLLPAVGEIDASSGVDVSFEVSGQVRAIYFTAGQHVKAGDKLIQLDNSAEAAQLKSIEAQLQNAEINLQRSERLLAQKAISQGAYDDALSLQKQMQANYNNIKALKERKLLRAPFAGEMGISQVSVGQYVNQGQVCANLQTVDALEVSFSVSQKDYASLHLNQPVEVKADSYPNQTFKGHVFALNNKFNEETRSLDVKAALDPSSTPLLPGMFVDVNVFLPVQHDVLVVPQTALAFTLYGESAFVVHFETEKKNGADVIVKDKNGFPLGKVQRVFVKTGDKRGNSAVVLEGLKAGDVVVNSGQSKIDDGSRVAINNSVQIMEQP